MDFCCEQAGEGKRVRAFAANILSCAKEKIRNKTSITVSFLIFPCETTFTVMVRRRECHFPVNCSVENLGEGRKLLQLHLQMQAREFV